jgi:hypothetical protein
VAAVATPTAALTVLSARQRELNGVDDQIQLDIFVVSVRENIK